MTIALRTLAIAIAVAALVDPAVALRQRNPLPIEFVLPAPSDPTHGEALGRARAIEAALAGAASLTSPDPAVARVVLGNGAVPADLSVPVFFVTSASGSPRALITGARADAEAVPGQAVMVATEVQGEGLAGRRSTITLLDRGIAIAKIEHGWTSEREQFMTHLPYVPSRPGVHPLTVQVRTPGVEDAAATIAAVAVERPLRVLVYEPRPSWAAAFVRRSLERDPAFAVAALARSGRGVSTRAGAAPRSFEALDAGAFDVLVVGTPDALAPSELAALDRFTSDRGGALLLVPDRRLTPAVHARFALPAMEELLLEKAVPAQADGLTVHASELLLPRGRGAYTSLATVETSSGARDAVVSVARGEGTVVVSGLLDAWRHRQLQAPGADTFWRGLVADLALAAPPRLQIRLDPVLAQPADRVKVTVTWRRDAVVRSGDFSVPATAAFMTGADGSKTMVRLWPGVRSGVFEATIAAPAAGLYTITAAADGSTADAILRVEERVVHPHRLSPAAATFAAAASGGAVVRDDRELVRRLESVAGPMMDRQVTPMRSPWWIVPFAGCLCAEWFLRRRRGLR
jgi:hypothetical protein